MEYWRIKINDEDCKRTRKEKWRKEKQIPKDKAANIITKEKIFLELKNNQKKIY